MSPQSCGIPSIADKSFVRDALDATMNYGVHAKFVAKWLDKLDAENESTDNGAASAPSTGTPTSAGLAAPATNTEETAGVSAAGPVANSDSAKAAGG